MVYNNSSRVSPYLASRSKKSTFSDRIKVFISSPITKAILFLIVLLIPALIRIFFLKDYPYPFSHPDTGQYTNGVIEMLNGGPFKPCIIKVSGTYSFFIFYILNIFGLNTINVIIIQTLLGLLTGIFSFLIIRNITKSYWISLVGLLLVTILPRGLLYEHVMLADSLYVFLLIFYFWLVTLILSKPSWYLAIILGLTSSLLILARGQGSISVLIGLLVIILLKINIKIKVLLLILFLLTISIPYFIYKQENIKYNNLPSLSIAGGYNMFWISTFRFIDFDSQINTDIKSIMKPYVEISNSYYSKLYSQGDDEESWGATNISTNLDSTFYSHYGDNWGLINQKFSEISLESIKSHPMAYIYRNYWNLRYYFFYNKNLDDTVDIKQFLLKDSSSNISIDRLKNFNTFPSDPLENYTDPLKTKRLTDHYANLNQNTVTDTILNKLSFLFNFRIFTFALYISIILLIFMKGKPKLLLGILVTMIFGQVLLTTVPSNALYDRYYIPVEPLIIIAFLVSFSYLFSNISKKEILQMIIIIISLPLTLILIYKFIYNLGINIFIDHPIIGLSSEKMIANNRAVVSLISTILIFSTFFILIYLSIKYKRKIIKLLSSIQKS